MNLVEQNFFLVIEGVGWMGLNGIFFFLLGKWDLGYWSWGL